jgi:penicillin-binding protein 1A
MDLDPFSAAARPEPAAPPVIPAPRVLSAQNAYIINSLMRDVIRRGTGRRARALGRQDLAGKTGTTNDQRDAWFAGFNGNLVAISWVGFDEPKPLGNRETGGRAALPMWMYFMGEALKGMPETLLERPPGMVTVRIDPKTGLLARANQPDAVFETFRQEYVPKQRATDETMSTADPYQPADNSPQIPEQLF